MMQTARAFFFAGLLLGISGMVFGQEADATVWFYTEILFERPKEEAALVTVTIISSETETYDPPIDEFEYTISNRVTTTFSIDDVIYGNEGFPLKSDSIIQINSDAKKVGDRYVVGYSLSTEGWWIAANSPLEPMSYGEFAAFYDDLVTNPCSIGMHYLVKNSDLEKICVRHDTRDRLIERGVGFFVPSLAFHEWKQISGDPPQDAGSDVYTGDRDGPHCNKRAVLSSTGDYCVRTGSNCRWAPSNTTDLGNNRLISRATQFLQHLPPTGCTTRSGNGSRYPVSLATTSVIGLHLTQNSSRLTQKTGSARRWIWQGPVGCLLRTRTSCYTTATTREWSR